MYKILLAGDGGQGVQLLSDIICQASFSKGLHVSHIPNYGLEQRGGASLAYIKISDKQIVYPKFFLPDLLLIMSDQARERTREYQQPGVEVLDIKDYEERLKLGNIPYSSINIFFLGGIIQKLSAIGLGDWSLAENMLIKKLETKPGWEDNKKAFNLSKQ